MAKESITRPITGQKLAGSVSEERKLAYAEASKTQALLPTYQAKVEALTVQSDEDLQLADALLGQVNDLRKGWEGIWKRIQDKTIKPIRQGLEELYALDRAVDKPLEALTAGIKAKMQVYVQDQLRQRREAERQRELLEQEAQRKRELAEQAKTPQMAGRLEREANMLAHAAENLVDEAPTPPSLTSAGLRQKTMPRVTGLAEFLVGIIEGVIPEDHIIVNLRALEQSWKQDPEGVAKWPGVTVSSEVGVVSRGKSVIDYTGGQ